MDRSSFLSSLPFLIPLQSHSWPPVRSVRSNGPDGTSTSSTTKVVLGETDQYNRSFFLSIEPYIHTSNLNHSNNTASGSTDGLATANEDNVDLSFVGSRKSGGPAFFSSTVALAENNDDPALTCIQIAIEEHHSSDKASLHPTTPPNRKETMNTKSPIMFHSPSNRLQSTLDQQSTGAAAFVTVVYLRLQGHVYALDLSQLEGIEIMPEVYAATKKAGAENADLDESENFSHSKAVAQPPSLVCRFDPAVFRIFSVRKTSRNSSTVSSNFRSANDVNEEKETLTSILDLLSKIVQDHQLQYGKKRILLPVGCDLSMP
jgi:hypothetical protein